MIKELEDIKKKLNYELYKIDTISNNNNLIFVDLKHDAVYKETNLINIYDIIKTNYPKLTFEIWQHSRPNTKSNLSEQDKKDFNKIDEAEELEAIKDLLMIHQKEVFGAFRNFILRDKQNVFGFTFKPIAQRIIKENKKKYFNIYQPSNDISKIKPKSNNDYPHIKKLIENILQEGYEHFIKTCAWKIQNPCDILPTHWIIRDDGGTGKTQLLAEIVLNKIFDIIIINQKTLESGFNSFMANTTWVIAEEIEGFENESLIKNLTTARDIVINEKFKTEIKIKNYNNWIIFSNDLRPLRLDDRDRRFNVVGGGKRIIPRPGSKDWSETIFKDNKDHEQFFEGFYKNLDKEIENLIADLLALKLTRNEVQSNIHTQYKQDLQEINYTSEQIFFKTLLDIGLDNVVKQYSSNPHAFLERNIVRKDEGINKGNWLKIKSLYELYKKYAIENGLRVIGIGHLTPRFKKIKRFNEIFGEQKIISDNNEKFQALRIIPTIEIRDEGNNMEKVEVIDVKK